MSDVFCNTTAPHNILKFKNYLLTLQNTICTTLEAFDTEVFMHDVWDYTNKNEGGGRSHILQEGSVFEKAGVNFSHIKSNNLPSTATLKRPELKNQAFEAMGLSLVIHPRNPFVPTTHANFRLFVTDTLWWFGGGYDLTPYYGFKEDAIHWHQTAFNACKPFGEGLYKQYKKNCDEYFYIPYRQETRGVGGLFFDDVNTGSFEESMSFIQSIANSFLTAYIPIVEKRKDMPFNQQQKKFQLMRRGRYVEFNLVYDRGTLFGLQSNGRIESILMSLPPAVEWRYNWIPTPGSPEAELTDFFLKPQDWLQLNQSEN